MTTQIEFPVNLELHSLFKRLFNVTYVFPSSRSPERKRTFPPIQLEKFLSPLLAAFFLMHESGNTLCTIIGDTSALIEPVCMIFDRNSGPLRLLPVT